MLALQENASRLSNSSEYRLEYHPPDKNKIK